MLLKWMKPFLVLLVAGWVLVSPSHATPIAYEGFDYTTGTLTGKSGGSGWSGSWGAVSGKAVHSVVSGSLTYSNGGNTLEAAGNKLSIAADGRGTRNFASTISTANQTYWVAYRGALTGTGAVPSTEASFALYNGLNGTGAVRIGLGKLGNRDNWGMWTTNASGSVQKSGTMTSADRDAMLLYKLVFTSSQLTISLWVNPSFSEGSLGVAHATLIAPHSTTIQSVNIMTGSDAANFQFDEFRMGTTFADVMPKLEIAYEAFDYATGSLTGKNSGSGWGGAWVAVSGKAVHSVASGSLTYSNGGNTLATAGNKLALSADGRGTRNFASTIMTGNQTYWVSLRGALPGTGAIPTNEASFALYSGQNGTGTVRIGLGKLGNRDNWGMWTTNASGSVQKSGTMTSADRDAMLIYKLVFTSSQVTISLWVNRPLSEGSLGVADATLVAPHSTNIESINIMTGASVTGFQFDEFRMGKTFASVAPLATGQTWNIAAGDAAGFQNALNNSALGDTIILQANTTGSNSIYTGSFTLPNKTTGSGWITIRSSNLSSLPGEGVRVKWSPTAPQDAVNMPRIMSPGVNIPALQTATSAHHYKLIGLEFVPANVSFHQGALVHLGSGGYVPGGELPQTTLAEVPQHLIVDRCIVRPFSPSQDLQGGISINSGNTDIINSHIISHYSGVQSYGIAGSNGTGPFKIDNNRLDVAGINFMIGGGKARISGVIPENIVFHRNHCTKRLEWRPGHPQFQGNSAGNRFTVVNLFEIKFGRNFDIQGNIFENTWNDAQDQAIIFKVDSNEYSNLTNDPNQTYAPKIKTEDVLFANNIVRHAPDAITLQGRDWLSNQPAQLRRVQIRDNLCYDISLTNWGAPSGPWAWSGGRFIRQTNGGQQFTIGNNTCFSDRGTLLTGDNLGDYPNRLLVDFVFRNNISRAYRGAEAWQDRHINSANNGKEGTAALDQDAPGAIFAKNVIANMNSSMISKYGVSTTPPFYNHASDNWLLTTTDFSGVLVNYNNGVGSPPFAGWKVVNGSPYDNGGTDGDDVGCDIDAVVAATAGCISGTW